MKKTLTLLMILLANFAYGGKIADQVNKKLNEKNFLVINPFKDGGKSVNIEILKELKEYNELTVDKYLENFIIKHKPENIRIFIPEIKKNVFLYKFDISDNLEVITSSGNRNKLNDIVHYRGIIENDNNSLVCFTFANNDISGIISNETGDYVVTKIDGTTRYILYNDRNLLFENNFECTSLPSLSIKKDEPNSQFVAGVKCINWYYETDYDIFVNKGSVANVTSYIQGAFAQVSTLYANDGMNIKLKTLFIWDTVDPYNGTTTSSLLTQFGQNRTSFNGDLAMLCGYVGNGGIAYVNTLCSSQNQYKMAYSDINSTYSIVPTYSWTIEVLAHEQGHNIASPHTHDCSWNGNNTRIDGCGPAAGYNTGSCVAGPIPTNGGTIMSYCHLLSGVGINFNNGFGPQPTSLMQNTIASKSCLFVCDSTSGGGGCTSAPTQPSTITGPTSVCSGSINTYSVTQDPNATSYIWQLPSGWTGSSTSNSISITSGSSSGNITVIATNSCGNSVSRILSVTSITVPATPGIITGPSAVCRNQSGVQYSVIPVLNASSYTWTVPPGAIITSGSNTNVITVTFGTKKGRITVKANNSCGSSGTRSLNINITCRESYLINSELNVRANPNPADDKLNLEIQSPSDSETKVILYDITGRVQYETSLNIKMGFNQHTIDVSQISVGTYFLHVINEETKIINKIIIE